MKQIRRQRFFSRQCKVATSEIGFQKSAAAPPPPPPTPSFRLRVSRGIFVVRRSPTCRLGVAPPSLSICSGPHEETPE
jgi:hypothetical protein